MVARWDLRSFVTVQDSESERPDSILQESLSIWYHISPQVSRNGDLQYRELTLERIAALASGEGA